MLFQTLCIICMKQERSALVKVLVSVELMPELSLLLKIKQKLCTLFNTLMFSLKVPCSIVTLYCGNF